MGKCLIMALLNNHNKFIFFHLYKCGGTSLRDILKPHLSDIMFPNKFQELGNAHSLPRDIREIYKNIDKIELFDSYYKFTFVRNPFDWLLSIYYYILKNVNHNEHFIVKDMSLLQFLNYYVNDMRKSNENKDLGHNKVTNLYEYVTDEKGNLLVDFIGRFENMENDMMLICQKLGLYFKDIPLLNVNLGKEKDYRKYYDTESIDFVNENFKKDLDYFNYKF